MSGKGNKGNKKKGGGGKQKQAEAISQQQPVAGSSQQKKGKQKQQSESSTQQQPVATQSKQKQPVVEQISQQQPVAAQPSKQKQPVVEPISQQQPAAAQPSKQPTAKKNKQKKFITEPSSQQPPAVTPSQELPFRSGPSGEQQRARGPPGFQSQTLESGAQTTRPQQSAWSSQTAIQPAPAAFSPQQSAWGQQPQYPGASPAYSQQPVQQYAAQAPPAMQLGWGARPPQPQPISSQKPPAWGPQYQQPPPAQAQPIPSQRSPAWGQQPQSAWPQASQGQKQPAWVHPQQQQQNLGAQQRYPPQPFQDPSVQYSTQTPQQPPSVWGTKQPAPQKAQQHEQVKAPVSQPTRQMSDVSTIPQKEPSYQQQGSGQGDTLPTKQQPQKGKGKQKQKERQPELGASTSRELSTGVSQMRLSDTQKSQGDKSIVPMNFKRFNSGSAGRRIQVQVNHFALNLGKLKTVHHYDVQFEPENIPKSYFREVMELFKKKYIAGVNPAFDGRKNLYSVNMLKLPNNTASEKFTVPTPSNSRTITITVKYVNSVDLSPLHNIELSRDTPREALQVVDIVLREAPTSKCITAGRSFYFRPSASDRAINLGEGMEMYHGLYQSAIRGFRPYLNVDVSHKAFPKSGPILDLLNELTESNRLPNELNYAQVQLLNYFIKNLKVLYEIPTHPDSKRVYRIKCVEGTARSNKFTVDGQQFTVETYFQQKKGYRIRYPTMPTLLVNSPNTQMKILLPIELCRVVEEQVTNKKMTERQTSNMIKIAATSTDDRKRKIMDVLRKAEYNRNPCVNEFGFSVGDQFLELDARILPPPDLRYASNRPITPRAGTWRGNRFCNPVTINNWTIIDVVRGERIPNHQQLAQALKEAAPSCGINFSDVRDIQRVQPTAGGINEYFRNNRNKYQLIFVIVPNSGPMYSLVKTAAEINNTCLTQCIKVGTLFKLNTSTSINILLKVNSKLNGTNHCLNEPPPVMQNCMIMGADVTHPSPDAQDTPSVAAVTASHDAKAFQYNICWRLQPPKVEIIEDLEKIVIEHLQYYQQRNRVDPEKIIFFRDGVSEGQFQQVRSSEIRAIQAACARFKSPAYRPKITFLVVQKRHHTRLFPKDKRDSEDRRNFNVPAGTCVDTEIVHPFMQDFYLVSHAAIQGVARPTKYCTLWDDNNFTNDDIEKLTYYLCHLFTRCTRSVSYPAPTYYAHLAAARAKIYITNKELNIRTLAEENNAFQSTNFNMRKSNPMFFV